MRVHPIPIILLAFLLVSVLSCGGGNGTEPTAPTYPSGKPTGVTAEPGSRSATIEWNPVPGALGYYVYISYDGFSFQKYLGQPVYTTRFTVLNLTNGMTYYFAVSAIGVGGWQSSLAYSGGSPSADPVIPREDIEEPIDDPLEPPENLQGVAKDGAAELEWDPPPSGDWAYYRIYRRLGLSGDFDDIVPSYTRPTYRDSDLVNDQIYCYHVTTVDAEGYESDPSNIVTLTPTDLIPEPIHGLEIYVGVGRIVLEWDIPLEADIASYAIERVEGVDLTGGEFIIRYVIPIPTAPPTDPHIHLGGLAESWVDVDSDHVVLKDLAVTVGVTYTYRISAIDISGQEGAPAEIIAPLPVY